MPYIKSIPETYRDEYLSAQSRARRERRGLWHQGRPTPPREYRKMQRARSRS